MRKLMLAVLMLITTTCFAQQVDLKSLEKMDAKAKGKTEISMDEAMVKAASGSLDDKKAEEGLAKKAAQELKGLYLRSFKFEKKGAYQMDDLKPLFDQLKAPNWKQFLREREDGEEAQIWFHYTNGVGDGMLLVSADEEEVTVINVVGTTDMGDFAFIGMVGKIAPMYKTFK